MIKGFCTLVRRDCLLERLVTLAKQLGMQMFVRYFEVLSNLQSFSLKFGVSCLVDVHIHVSLVFYLGCICISDLLKSSFDLSFLKDLIQNYYFVFFFLQKRFVEMQCFHNPFHATGFFLYPLKHWVFLCFQGV